MIGRYSVYRLVKLGQFITITLCALALLACGNKGKNGQLGDNVPNTSSSSSNSSSSSSSSGLVLPMGPPVPTAEPNAENQTPAFPEQTRAPEVRSSFTLKTELVTSALENPWGMARLPDGRWLITEKGGNFSRASALVIVTPAGKISAPIQGLPELSNQGQGGLLDVSLDPNFATNRMVYLSYSEPTGEREFGTSVDSTSVARVKLSKDETRLENWQVIFTQTPARHGELHYGSRLAWDKNGLLYVTLGERDTANSPPLAQDLSTSLGKVVRIKSDGTVPADNPFVGVLNALPQIWSYGHRNPQGAAIHPVTGELWTSEHGPQGGDEVNRPERGKNYGWPIITYGQNYNGAPIGDGITAKVGMEQPVYYFDPIIAPSGINFYQGTLFTGWQNNLLIASLTPGGLVRLILEGNKVVGEERVVKELGRVRDVDIAADGSIWLITDSGQLNRLTPM